MGLKIRKKADTLIRRIIGPFSGGKRPGNIVMYHIGRCGSGVLASLLRQHRRVYWDGELYAPVFARWRDENNGVETVREFPEDPVRRLEKRMVLACSSFYGFEIKPFHHRLIGCSAEPFIDKLDSLGFTHFIILDRRNRLRKIVSSIISHERTGVYHSVQGKEAALNRVAVDSDDVRIDFSAKPLLEYLSEYDEQFDSLKNLLKARNLLELTYEDDIQEDPEKGYQRVCRFLEIEPQKVTVRLSRTNPFPLRDMIENFNEVEDILSGTPYEWMLKD